jgi:serine/threonine-protein kinase
MRLGLDGANLRLSGHGQAFTVDLKASVLDTIAETIRTVPRVRLRDAAPGEEPSPIVQPAAEADASIRYRIDGEIARGGMGAILKGRDPDLNRDVALKVLREELQDHPDMVRRFVEEAQIGGQLQHPGIVPIYELGAFADHRPFFSMKLVKGQTLAALLAGRPSPSAELPRFLAIFEAICQTVAYAHAHGVIHRDLKPSNVMVGSFGEVQVMDWGLAKVLPRGGIRDDAQTGETRTGETIIATARSGSDAPELSHAGSVLGTPSYMAPEQARGEPADERADVFALGSILCEILTGAPAFLGRSTGEIQRKAALGDTADALARLDACGANAELVALAKSNLEREPADRPRHAGAVASGITGYLTGVQERVKAAERERAVAEAKAVEERRRRKLQLGLAACLVALVAAAGLGTSYYLQERAARNALVARVLSQAGTLLEVANREPEDLARWEAALAAVRQAETALPAGAGRDARRRLAGLRDAVRTGAEAARRDHALIDALADVRSSEGDLSLAGADASYARAFRDAGFDLEQHTPAEIGSRLKDRPAAVAVAAAAALDGWALIRLVDPLKVARWRRPLEAARAADADPFRNQVRAALADSDRAAMKALAADPKAAELPPASVVLLAAVLEDHAMAVTMLRGAASRHPDDVWVNYALAYRLGWLRPAPREEQVRYYSAARAVRPDTAHELAHLLETMGRVDEALAVFADLIARRPVDARNLTCYGQALRDHGRREAGPILERAVSAGRAAIRRKPDDAVARNTLGVALKDQGHLDEAIAEHRAAIHLRPDDPIAHGNLGVALKAQGHLDEAIAEFRRAVRLAPGDARSHGNLGGTLQGQGQLEEAIAELREAIRLQPDYATAYYNLGSALRDQGHLDEAIAEFRTAIRLKTDFTEAHINLGNVLQAHGPLDEAITSYRAAIRLRPDVVEAHYGLANALQAQAHVDEAIAEFRAAIRLKPDFAEAHCNLGRALRSLADYPAALEAYRKGHELGSRQPGWRYPSAQWVREAERLAALAQRLPDVLRGEDRPADTAERLMLAEMAYNTKRFAGVAQLWAEALAADPQFGDRQAQRRYIVACAAALAASGQGKDDPPPDDAARTRLRAQALAWLRAEWAAWSKVANSGDPKARAGVAATLRHWQSDPSLAGVRDAAELERLPESERTPWRALWDDVERLRGKTAP